MASRSSGRSTPARSDRGRPSPSTGSALRRATAEQILDGARAYAAEVRERDREEEFIAFPANWLRYDRWADEPADAAPALPRPPTASPRLAELPDCPDGKPGGHLIRPKHGTPECGSCRARFKADPAEYAIWLLEYRDALSPTEETGR